MIAKIGKADRKRRVVSSAMPTTGLCTFAYSKISKVFNASAVRSFCWTDWQTLILQRQLVSVLVALYFVQPLYMVK